MAQHVATAQPLFHLCQEAAQETEGRLRTIQAVEPATQGGRVSNAVRIFDGGGCRFP